MLGERREVGVVVDQHGPGQALGEHLAHVDVVPPAQDAAHRDHPGVLVDGGGQGDADGQQLVHGGPDALEQLDDEQRGTVQARVEAVVDGQRHVLLGEDLAVRVPECHGEATPPELDGGHHAEPPGQRDHLRAAPGARRGACVDDPGARELLDDRRHGRRREPRRLRELDLGQPSVATDRVDDPESVRFSEGGLRSGGGPVAVHRPQITRSARSRTGRSAAHPMS
ncbi:Uncharacterised protein [Mycobacteroides abscessus]|nr:Uncharacterised protein [Mycobacteroides abscessus]